MVQHARQRQPGQGPPALPARTREDPMNSVLSAATQSVRAFWVDYERAARAAGTAQPTLGRGVPALRAGRPTPRAPSPAAAWSALQRHLRRMVSGLGATGPPASSARRRLTPPIRTVPAGVLMTERFASRRCTTRTTFAFAWTATRPRAAAGRGRPADRRLPAPPGRHGWPYAFAEILPVADRLAADEDLLTNFDDLQIECWLGDDALRWRAFQLRQ